MSDADYTPWPAAAPTATIEPPAIDYVTWPGESELPPPPPSTPAGPTGGGGMRRALPAAAAFVALFVGSAAAGVAWQHRASSSSNATASRLLPSAPSGSSGSSSSSGGSSGSSSSPNTSGSNSTGVVDITTSLNGGQGRAAGTGMILTSNGVVLTNNHVIAYSDSISAQVNGTGTSYSAKVVGYDPANDVAVIQLQNASKLPTVTLGDSSKLSEGDTVIAVGNALGKPGPDTVTEGQITALNQTITAGDPNGESETLRNTIQTDAAIQPGDSGGPLLDSSSKVIGMITAGSGGTRRSASGEGFAIPINTARSLAQQIIDGKSGGTVHLGARGILGVEIQPGSGQGGFGGRSRGGSGGGAVISGVQDNTPASDAGMAEGDTITAIAGKSVASTSDVSTLLNAYHPGDKVLVTWTDSSGKTRQATIKLIPGPPA